MICQKCLRETDPEILPTRLVVGDQKLRLTPIVAALLEPLVENQGELVAWSRIRDGMYLSSREGLSASSQDNAGQHKSTKVILCKLRSELRILTERVEIRTIWGRGLALHTKAEVSLS